MAKINVKFSSGVNTLNIMCDGICFYSLEMEKGARVDNQILKNIVKNSMECLHVSKGDPKGIESTLSESIKEILKRNGLYKEGLKTLVLKLRNNINGHPRYCVKFNYMTEINKSAFREVKDGFNFSTFDSVQHFLTENVERFLESKLVIVNNKKDFRF